SECWDVKLKFFDPENGLRAKRVFRFTIDVSDRTPVTLGEVRSWAVSK
ncbi:peptidase, partial [Microcystis aeruginosa CS-573]|nr:peptidase [Microcystis aeruginosa CS-573]MDB9397028.1 peptidase [Microcystis aeruginosa CS-573]